MGQVFPFRNCKGPSERSPCERCGAEIPPRNGYAVLYQGIIDGWVCEECFAEGFEPADDFIDHVHLLSIN